MTGRSVDMCGCTGTRRAFAGAVLGLALVLRLAFLVAVLAGNNPAAWSAPDTASYRSMADSFLQAGNFTTGHQDVRLHALSRPPGYPLLLALVSGLGLGDRGLLLLQVLCSTAAVAGILCLSFWFTGRWFWSCAIALVAAVSPTAVAAPAILLTDSLFAFWILAGLVICFWPGTRREHLRAGLYGLSLVLALYIKPGLVFYLPLSLMWWVAGVLKRKARGSAPAVVWVLIIQLTGWGLWTHRNARVENIASFSTIGKLAAVQYLAAQVKARVEGRDVWEEKNAVFARTEKQFREHPGRLDAVFRDLGKESAAVFRQHRRQTLDCFLENIRDNVSSDWGLWRKQLGLSPDAPAPVLETLFAADARWRARLLWLSPLVLLPLSVLQVWRQRCKALPYVSIALAALGTTAYFTLISGVTYWTGSRIIFPAESTILLSWALIFPRPTAFTSAP